jgi:exopolyphosphatase/pppGpp-phosphohydrolase
MTTMVVPIVMETRMSMDGRRLPLKQQLPLKIQLMERWVARRLGAIAHERRVLTVAKHLFDLTQPLHGLGSAERNLLSLCALAHDVGRSVDDDDHPRIGSRMILSDNWLPITPAERRAIAYVTRYHRGQVPEMGEDDILFPGDAVADARVLLAILRVADTFDCRSLSSPRLTLHLRGRRLAITCVVTDDELCKAEKTYTRRKKLRMLEELLHCRIDVDVKSVEDVELVA